MIVLVGKTEPFAVSARRSHMSSLSWSANAVAGALPILSPGLRIECTKDDVGAMFGGDGMILRTSIKTQRCQ
jgi:hypothetical protein